LSGALDECRGETGIAAILVSMDVEETDPFFDCQVKRQIKVQAFFDSVHQMDSELTHHVVEDENGLDAIHVIFQRLTE
jgi:hypothetical protein